MKTIDHSEFLSLQCLNNFRKHCQQGNVILITIALNGLTCWGWGGVTLGSVTHLRVGAWTKKNHKRLFYTCRKTRLPVLPTEAVKNPYPAGKSNVNFLLVFSGSGAGLFVLPACLQGKLLHFTVADPEGGATRRAPPLNFYRLWCFFSSPFVSKCLKIRLGQHERTFKALQSFQDPLAGPELRPLGTLLFALRRSRCALQLRTTQSFAPPLFKNPGSTSVSFQVCDIDTGIVLNFSLDFLTMIHVMVNVIVWLLDPCTAKWNNVKNCVLHSPIKVCLQLYLILILTHCMFIFV